jgi:hypothetical protein
MGLGIGRNQSVRSVAAAASAKANKIKWTSGVLVERIGPNGRESVRPLQQGETLTFYSSSFGAPANLAFMLQVYAPGMTDQLKNIQDYRQKFDAGAQVAKKLRIEIESPFVPNGKQVLHVDGSDGGPLAGIDNNDLILSYALTDQVNQYPASGVYPMKIKAEGKLIGQFKLNWVVQ